MMLDSCRMLIAKSVSFLFIVQPKPNHAGQRERKEERKDERQYTAKSYDEMTQLHSIWAIFVSLTGEFLFLLPHNKTIIAIFSNSQFNNLDLWVYPD
jgi:hypothetical protein